MQLGSKLKWRLGYVLFGIVCLALSLYATFPAQVLADRLAKELELGTQGAWTLHAKHASLWRGTGLTLGEVSLKPADGPSIEIDQIRARLRLMPLLFARPSVYGQINLGDGQIEVWVTRKNKATAIAVETHALDVARPALLPKLVGLAMTGVIEAKGELIVPGDAREIEGNLTAELSKVSIGPGNLQGLSLPTIPAGDLELALDAGEGHLKITKFSQSGGVLRLEAQGHSELSGALGSSPIDLCLRLRFDPGYLAQNGKLKTLLQLAEVQLKKDPEGFLNIPLLGHLSDPQVRPGLCPKR